MRQFAALLNKLDLRARGLVIAGVVLSVILIALLARSASRPTMSLLFGGLEASAAGEVVQTLEQRGVIFEVRGDAIYVPHAQRDELRMLLAASGLPASSVSGYELLDQLSGFGTTSQMFDAAFWRAKEGELARTIASSPLIRQARVHLAAGPASMFRRDQAISASVTVTPIVGKLNAEQARAIRHLVASAVSGMRADDVAVIDGVSGTVYAVGSDGTNADLQADRIFDLRRRVERLLDAHVGFGRSVVEISVETVLDRETVRERLLDPERRVAVATETEETTSSSTGQNGQGVTVASNLPDGEGSAASGTSENRENQNRVRSTFDVSETQREIERAPGAIRRLTVAVLVDGQRSVDAAGTETWSPRPEQEMEALRELVASAVGFDEARGDVITLRTLPFEEPENLGTDSGSGLFSFESLDVMTLAKWLLLVLALLIVSVFVIRPLLLAARSTRPDLANNSLQLPTLPPPFDPTSSASARALSYEGGQIESESRQAAPVDPVSRLRELISQRQGDSVEALRHWIEQSKEPPHKG